MDESENAMDRPYTEDEIRANMDDDCYVTGRVKVSLSELIDNDLESFLDLLGERLVDNPCLMNVSYKAVGITDIDSGDADIIIEVTGDVSEVIETEDEDEEEESCI